MSDSQSPTGEVHTPSTVRTRADPALLKALARAFRWQRLLDEGRYGSVSELAQVERIERGYLGRVLQLTLFPPRVVEAIVDGRQGADVSLPELMGVGEGDLEQLTEGGTAGNGNSYVGQPDMDGCGLTALF